MYWHMDHVGIDIRAEHNNQVQKPVHLFVIATFEQS